MFAVLGQRAARAERTLFKILSAGRHTTSQTFVRVTILLLIALVAASSLFELDIVLGAFVAVTTVAVDAGVMSDSLASVFISAGALTVLIMPLLANIAYQAPNKQTSSK